MRAPSRKAKGPRHPGGVPSLVRRGALLLGLVLLAYLLRVPLLRGVGDFLVVDDRPERADLIYLLGGDIHARPDLAAALFHEGVAPRIVTARVADSPITLSGRYPNETDAAVAYLRDLGVPDSAIVVLRRPGGVDSTDDEAEEVRAYVEREGARTILLVTSSYHTRRARWLFRRVLDDLAVEVRTAGAPTATVDHDTWWRTEEGLLRYFEEYVKFVHNGVYR